MEDDQYEDWSDDLAAARGVFNGIVISVGLVLASIIAISVIALVLA